MTTLTFRLADIHAEAKRRADSRTPELARLILARDLTLPTVEFTGYTAYAPRDFHQISTTFWHKLFGTNGCASSWRQTTRLGSDKAISWSREAVVYVPEDVAFMWEEPGTPSRYRKAYGEMRFIAMCGSDRFCEVRRNPHIYTQTPGYDGQDIQVDVTPNTTFSDDYYIQSCGTYYREQEFLSRPPRHYYDPDHYEDE